MVFWCRKKWNPWFRFSLGFGHLEAITWICSNEVFVVTAGCDHVVRARGTRELNTGRALVDPVPATFKGIGEQAIYESAALHVSCGHMQPCVPCCEVWPVDFNSFYLHSKHDSVVVGLDLTVDGRKVGDPGLSMDGCKDRCRGGGWRFVMDIWIRAFASH